MSVPARIAVIAAALLATACGGGDGSSDVAAGAPSAGGMWFSVGGDEPLTLYIAEDGELRASGASIGTGSVTVSLDGQLSGTVRRVPLSVSGFTSVAVVRPPAAPAAPTLADRSAEQSCTVSGTVSPRTVLTATFACTSASGATTTRRYDLAYFAPGYEVPASLDRLGGNYTLAFAPNGNTLNVNSDGEVFGMYNNGWRCTVNGRFRSIDARFNLLRAEWTFSNCAVPASRRFEGVTFTGFVRRNTGVASDAFGPDALYLLLTGSVQGQLTQISVFYERT